MRHRKIICVEADDIPDVETLRAMGADIPEGAVCVQMSTAPFFDDYHWNHNVIGMKFEHPDYPPTERGGDCPVQHLGH